MASNAVLKDFKNLDAFYTNPKIARFCLERLRNLITQNLGLDLINFHFLEPSAGNGSFVYALKELGITNLLALDIAPNAQSIQKKDYLKEFIKFNQKRIVVGNPPFGHRGKLALDFLNKSLNEAPIVAFILPNLFKRYSIQKHIDERAKLVLSVNLEKNAFIFNERPYDVKCVFQVYMHKNTALNLKDERIYNPPKIRHNDFITYIHNNTPNTLKYFNKEEYQWDFAVVRQGFYDYNEKITNAKLLVKNRQYFFIKAHSKEALAIINKIDFNKLAHKNTQVLGFSTYDFVEEYCRLKELYA
ncbi:type II methylase [Helicobacter cetorum]|uniref:Type II DNA methylase protein n=1 Tax=Helicobacter cetorum (strain ATCC BAA-540 / CCUG 52418 / MIT 99-5656) TaxID=1163745 RepID=I0ESM3_HELCM|nr:type II methylase [Helicobacter cetorum]AFI05942.1 type II DNA methylase protein [Helicobacter cetorum MIT 99-5656]